MSGQDARYTIFEALRKPIAWLFKTDDEHATIYRLFNSKRKNYSAVVIARCPIFGMMDCEQLERPDRGCQKPGGASRSGG